MSSIVTKTCITCKYSKSINNFGLIGGRRRRVCSQCIGKDNTRSQTYARPKSGTKYCIGCNEVYDISNFQSDPTNTTGLNTYCYNCKPDLLVGSKQLPQNKNPTFFSQLFKALGFKQCVNSEPEEDKSNYSVPNRNPMKKQNPSYVILKLLYGFN